MTEKLALTLREVSEWSGLGLSAVTAAVETGELPAKFKPGSTRYRVILRKDVLAWLDNLEPA